jgi:hypothetical protein
MNGFEPPQSLDLVKEFLNMDENPCPDLIIIGLQEYLGNNTAEVGINNWNQLILKNLARISEESYMLIKSKEYSDCVSLFYAKTKLKDRITRVSHDTIKLGLIGNRAAVILKFFFDDSSFCFTNVSLEPGSKSSARIQNINDIH